MSARAHTPTGSSFTPKLNVLEYDTLAAPKRPAEAADSWERASSSGVLNTCASQAFYV